jgi:hypothetical protein
MTLAWGVQKRLTSAAMARMQTCVLAGIVNGPQLTALQPGGMLAVLA